MVSIKVRTLVFYENVKQSCDKNVVIRHKFKVIIYITNI